MRGWLGAALGCALVAPIIAGCGQSDVDIIGSCEVAGEAVQLAGAVSASDPFYPLGVAHPSVGRIGDYTLVSWLEFGPADPATGWPAYCTRRARWFDAHLQPASDVISLGRACSDCGSTTWRLPSSLESGLEFSGHIEAAALRLTRRFRVVREERVTVAAGAFDAWRVDIEERTSWSGAEEVYTRAGALWLAAGPGLVRLRLADGRVEVEQSLVAWSDGRIVP